MVRRKWWQPRRTAVAGARPSVLLESIPPHIQNWPFIFSDLRMPLLPGCPTTRLQCLWIGKRHRDEPVRRRFQGTVSTMCEQQPINLWQVSTSLQTGQWAVIPPGSSSTKGNLERADSPAGQLLATRATAEFSVLTRGNAQKHGVPCFLFRSAACQLGWPPGHSYIFFSNSKLQVAHTRGGKAVAKHGPTVFHTPKPTASTKFLNYFLKKI